MRSSAAGTNGSLQRCNKHGIKAPAHFGSGTPTRENRWTEIPGDEPELRAFI
jgi:hypothetical protein